VGVAVKELKELRAALDKEARARSEELSRTSTSLSREIAHLAEELQRIEARLRGEVEAETRARLAEKEHQLHVAQELSARVTELSTSLEQERVERDSGDSTLRGQITSCRQDILAIKNAEAELEGRVEAETRAQHSANAEAMSRYQELRTALEQERSERERGDSTLRSQIGEFQQELRSEREERVAELGRSLQSLEGIVVQRLDSETSKRKELSSWLEKSCKELRSSLEAEVIKREQLAEELNVRIKDVRRLLDNEVETRTEEHSRVALNLSRIQSQFETLSREYNHAFGEFENRLKALSDALSIEATERREAQAELERGYRSLSTNLDNEARQRTQAIAALQDERKAGDDALERSARMAVQRLETIIESLREALWAKMVSLMDRMIASGREWRDTPPTIDFSPHSPVLAVAALELHKDGYTPGRPLTTSIGTPLSGRLSPHAP